MEVFLSSAFEQFIEGDFTEVDIQRTVSIQEGAHVGAAHHGIVEAVVEQGDNLSRVLLAPLLCLFGQGFGFWFDDGLGSALGDKVAEIIDDRVFLFLAG